MPNRNLSSASDNLPARIIRETAAPTQIVLIDDDDLFRESLGLNLIDEGYEGTSFSSGAPADRGTAPSPNRCRARGGHALRLVNSAPPSPAGVFYHQPTAPTPEGPGSAWAPGLISPQDKRSPPRPH